MLEPAVPEARPDVPAKWEPAAGAAESAEAAGIGWRDFLASPKLVALVEQALANNRDLRVAVLNVERARALHQIQRSDRFPSVDASGALVRSGGDNRDTTSAYTASVGITQFEIDLFGRVMSLDKAALERYFAEEENQRSVRLALVAEVANAWLALAADREQLRLARATLATREDEFRLSAKRKELGAISALDHAQVRTLVEAARADAARYEGQVAADRNALALLVGGPFDPALLPEGWEGTVTRWKGVPAGLTSELLLRRPDIRAAEHSLLAANANIGAARAAFFPSITLTGSAGTAASELSGLFKSGTFAWSVVPQVNLPIFQGGRLTAGLEVATVDRDIALARYERSIQSGFREVADALAFSATLADQRRALEATVEAASEADRLARARYQAGQDSYLGRLVNQRTLYVSQQGLISTRLAEQANWVTLYKVLGGDWREAGTVSALQRRTPKAEAHAESQRERILDAAQKCFIEHGFHGASMARIAEDGRDQRGPRLPLLRQQERHHAGDHRARARGQARADPGAVRPGTISSTPSWRSSAAWQSGSPDVMNAAIFLEMSAEASRSPEIAQAIRASDAHGPPGIRALAADGPPRGRSRAHRPGRRTRAGLLMQCLIEGLVVRAARDPDLDPKALRRALEPVFRHQGFLPPASSPSADPA